MSLRLATIFLIATYVGGCGFQLEGAGELVEGLQRVNIQAADPYSPFVRAFQQRVRQLGGTVVQGRDAADVVVTVLADETGQRVLSVSSRNLPREYEVFYLLRFSVTGPTGSASEAQSLDVIRSYAFDETQVLGKRNEEVTLRRSLAEDLARQVIRRIDTLAP
jgi:LPS-assembly lipoprotein